MYLVVAPDADFAFADDKVFLVASSIGELPDMKQTILAVQFHANLFQRNFLLEFR